MFVSSGTDYLAAAQFFQATQARWVAACREVEVRKPTERQDLGVASDVQKHTRCVERMNNLLQVRKFS